jgi:FixJ family two-component response regulator
VIIVSGDPIELAGTALKQGAYAWIHKPFQAGCLLEIVGKATEQYSEMQQ